MQYTVPSRHGDGLRVVPALWRTGTPAVPISSCRASPLALCTPGTLPAFLSLKGTAACLALAVPSPIPPPGTGTGTGTPS